MAFTIKDKISLWMSAILFGFLLFLYSIYLITEDWYNIKGSYFYSVNSFSITEGIVESASIGQGQVNYGGKYSLPDNFYYPKISYTFVVNKRKYYSDKISFSDLRFKDYENISHYINKFPVGQNITVYYKENNPEISVLNVNNREYYFGRIFGILFFPSLIVIFVIRKFSKKKNYEANYLLKEELDKIVN